MATFPNELKPFFVENNKLIRLGSIDDGGYVVPLKSIKNSKSLVSFGICDNWDFEKDFTKKANVNVYAYDHSIDKNFWLARFKKDFIKFLKFKIFKPKKIYKMFQYLDFLFFFKFNKKNNFYLRKIGKGGDSLNLDKIINNHLIIKNHIFLKIDIEGYEYEILNEIILYQERIEGIVIEFHDVSQNLSRIIEFISQLSPYLQLAHIHGNNYSIKNINSFPEAIELTFSRNLNTTKFNSKVYPLKNLDFPNSKRSPDVEIKFEN